MNATARPAASKKSRAPSLLFGSIVISVLAWGWFERREYWYSADHGLGYAFGITGLSLMGLLLLYPLRKHWQPMARLFPIRYWFRMHMVLGIVGPTFILFHANFNQGSINSSVALYSMLLVAGSGLVGRYVYTRIHRGLYGEAIRYSDLVMEFDLAGSVGRGAVDDRIAAIKSRLDSNTGSTVGLLFTMVALRHRAAKTADAREAQVFAALSRMASLRAFSRLFSMWHVLHLPIFFMMLITAAVHVVVVHMY